MIIPLLSYDSYQCAMWYDEDDASTIARFASDILSTSVQLAYCEPLKHWPKPNFSLTGSAYITWALDSLENYLWLRSLVINLYQNRVKRTPPEFLWRIPHKFLELIATETEFLIPPHALSESSLTILQSYTGDNVSALVRSLYRLDYCQGPARRWRSAPPPPWYVRPGYRPKP